MEVLILDQNAHYHPEAQSRWKKVPLSVEDAIQQYSGIRTIQLIWEDTTGAKFMTMLLSHTDQMNIANKTAEIVVEQIKKQFSK